MDMKQTLTRKSKLSYVVMLLVMMAMPFLAACSDDDDEAVLTVTNDTGSMTLSRFTIVFVNHLGETLTDREYGTFSPGDRISAEIPIGAEEYYMGTYLNAWYFSPNYPASITNNVLTYDGVGQWRTN